MADVQGVFYFQWLCLDSPWNAVGDEEGDLRRTLQSLAREEGWRGLRVMGPHWDLRPNGPECSATLLFVGFSPTWMAQVQLTRLFGKCD